MSIAALWLWRGTSDLALVPDALVVDMIVHRKQMREHLGKLLDYFSGRGKRKFKAA